MKKGDLKMLTIDRQQMTLSYLGKGEFVTAWLNDVTKDVYLVGNDMTKDCIANWGQADNPHIPVLAIVDQLENGRYVYKTRYYDKLTASNKVAWGQFRALEELLAAAFSNVRAHVGWLNFNPRQHGFDVCQELCNLAYNDSRILPSIAEALQHMQDAVSNAGSDVLPEFSRQNLGVDESGNLVLLDVFFNYSR
jgi:hypothetical protein